MDMPLADKVPDGTPCAARTLSLRRKLGLVRKAVLQKRRNQLTDAAGEPHMGKKRIENPIVKMIAEDRSRRTERLVRLVTRPKLQPKPSGPRRKRDR